MKTLLNFRTLLLSSFIMVLFLTTFSACKRDEPITTVEPNSGIPTSLSEEDQQMYENLQMLSAGFLHTYQKIQKNYTNKNSDAETIMRLIFEQASRGLNEYYYVSFERLFAQAEEAGIPLEEMVNNSITTVFELPSGSNPLGDILDVTEYNGNPTFYHFIIPFLHLHAGKEIQENYTMEKLTDGDIDELVGQAATGAYVLLESGYPINGITFDAPDGDSPTVDEFIALISKSEALSNPTMIIVSGPIDDCFIDSDAIGDCPTDEVFINFNDCINELSTCATCPGSNVNYTNGINNISTNGLGNTQSHEFQFFYYPEYFAQCFENSESNQPYFLLEAENTSWPIWIKQHVNNGYYNIDALGEYPIIAQSGEQGNKMKLCINSNMAIDYNGSIFPDGDNGSEQIPISGVSNFIFKQGNEDGDATAQLASNNIYKLSIPGSDVLPIYMYFPMASGFWYNDPDSKLLYLIDTFDESCVDELNKVEEFYHAQSNYFNEFSNYSNPHRYIFNTNKQVLESYWEIPRLFVGFETGQTVNKLNSREYNVNTPNNAVSIPDNYELIAELSGDYLSGDYQTNFNEPIVLNDNDSSPTEVAIHVSGVFKPKVTNVVGNAVPFNYLETMELTKTNSNNSSIQSFNTLSLYFSGIRAGFNYDVSIYKIN